MGKSINRAIVVEALVFVIWAVLLLGVVGGPVWACVFFSLIAWGVSAASIYLFEARQAGADAEVRALPILFSEAYYGAVLVINTVFALLARAGGTKYMIILNVIALVVFVILRMSAGDYAKDVTEKTEYVAQSVNRTKLISAQVALVLSSCTDPDAKKQMLRLKETIDMGEGLSSGTAAPEEKEFLDKLEEIQGLLDQKADNALVLQKINEASGIWKKRVIVASSLK